jgi:hypothetical protein
MKDFTTTTPKLSKSKYVKGCNCNLALWLYVHEPQVAEVDDAQVQLMQSGTNIGDMARDYFPGGELAVKENEYPGEATAAYTQALIAKGVTTIYEAVFIYDNIVVAIDILTKVNGAWQAYEVKSTLDVKDYHITDTSIQYFVIKNSGLALEDIFVMNLNRDYYRIGELDIQQLFKPTSVLENILPLQNNIPLNANNLRVMLQQAQPVVAMGEQCSKPFACEFVQHCNTINGFVEVEEEEMKHDAPTINEEEVKEFVNSCAYPLAFLDFETIMPKLPEYEYSSPFQQLVFQYSCHTQQDKNTEVLHHEMLAKAEGDPRLQIIPNLIEACNGAKTIFVYNATFERGRLQEMLEDFPQYATDLQNIIDHLVDLAPVFRKHYKTKTLGRKWSIKLLLPLYVPELSYNDLEIADGGNASESFYNLYKETDENVIQEVRKDLIEYCKLDTYAMVKLWEVLKKV